MKLKKSNRTQTEKKLNQTKTKPSQTEKNQAGRFEPISVFFPKKPVFVIFLTKTKSNKK
jgi:hypothetical protein